MMYHEPQKHDTNAIPCMGDAADLLLNAISEHQPESHESLLSSDINLVMSINSMPIIPEECTTIIGVEDPLRRDPAIQDRLGESILSNGGQWIKMSAKFRRWGPDSLTEGGTINRRGWKAISKAVTNAGTRQLSASEANIVDTDVDDEFILEHWPDRKVVKTNLSIALIFLTTMRSKAVPTAILENKVVMPNTAWDPVEVGEHIDWSIKGPDRSWQSCFLALDFLKNAATVLSQRLLETGGDGTDSDPEKEDLSRALTRRITDVAIDFIESNPPGGGGASRCWHEGTATKRLVNLLGIYTVLHAQTGMERDWLLSSLSRIHKSILVHAALIMDPRQYIRSGNHGLRQDVFLYAAGSIINNITGECTWAKTAMERTSEFQVDLGVGPDGAWCEHSTGYHYLVMNLLGKMFKAASLAKNSDDLRYLSAVIMRMMDHYRLIANNDSSLPMIGDTSAKHAAGGDAAAERRTALMNLHDLVSQGPTGKAATSRDPRSSIRPRSGFDRSGWFRARSSDELEVLFHAQLNSAKHKHADDLSFVVRKNGIEWVVDPGALNKEVGNQIRDHFRLDASAHNTYTVNDLSYPFKRMDCRTMLDLHFEGDGWSAASGINERYAGGSVRRTMLVLHELGSIFIVDYLLSKGETCKWNSHLHLGLGIEATKTSDQAILATSPRGETMRVDYHGPTPNLSIITGQKEPPLGWLETGWSKSAPASVVVNELHGDKVVSAMHITFGDSPCPAEVAILGKKTTVTLDTATDKASRWMIEAKTGDVEFVTL